MIFLSSLQAPAQEQSDHLRALSSFCGRGSLFFFNRPVVLVTTKKAKEGAPTLTYDGTFGFRQATNLIEPLNAEEQVEMRRRSYENAGQALPDGWNVTKNPY